MKISWQPGGGVHIRQCERRLVTGRVAICKQSVLNYFAVSTIFAVGQVGAARASHYSTVTLLAKFRGLSTSVPRLTAV
jgi:hypothetical protein